MNLIEEARNKRPVAMPKLFRHLPMRMRIILISSMKKTA